MRKTISILMCLALMSVPMSAQTQPEQGNMTNPKRVDYTNTSELDLNVGYPPLYTLSILTVSPIFRAISSFNFLDETDIVMPSGEPATFLPVFRLDYGYNVLPWLNLGGGIDYSYASQPMMYNDTKNYAWDEMLHMVNVTYKMKFYWLNRKWVRMYSGFSLGVCIIRTNLLSMTPEDAANPYNGIGLYLGLSPIGIMVGDENLYGRFEIGNGGSLISAGIGWRFHHKK